MANHQQVQNVPLDVRALFGLNDETLEYAERAYRSWQQGAETIQTHALGYWSAEVQKVLDAMKQMSECQTAAEAMNVQSRYATEAMQTLVAEGRKMMDELATLTATPWSGVPDRSAEQTRSKRAERRT